MKKFRYDLTPLSAPKADFERFGTFDIEGREWIKFLVAGAYDGERYESFKSVHEFLEWAFAGECRTYFCHFGAIYDFLFILQTCLEEGFEIRDMVPRGSGLLSFRVVWEGEMITFRDSGALLPMSLEKITKSFGVKTPKVKMDVTNLKRVTPELLRYLEADCRGLHESLDKFFKSPLVASAGPKSTMASQALQIYRTFLTEKIPSMKPWADDYIRETYAGGRTEIFRPLYNDKSGEKTLHYFDVNSLYPFIMATNDFCFEFDKVSRQIDWDADGFADVTVHSPESEYLPILWKKSPKFIFYNGVFRGKFAMPELRYAVENGVEILKVHSFMKFQKGRPIFRDFIQTLYRLRQETTDEVQNLIAKLTMNSLYGRMGLNLEREGIDFDHGQEGVTPHFEIKTKKGIFRFVKFPNEISSFTNVAIASYVTALARIHMHRLLKPIQDDIFYMDTDSVVTTRKLASSTALGDLKFEKSESCAVFLLPKTYVMGEQVTMKGFSNRKVQHFTFDDFENYFYGQGRLKIKMPPQMKRMKTAMRAGGFLKLTEDSEREVKAKYDKREIVRGTKYLWDSKPLEVFE